MLNRVIDSHEFEVSGTQLTPAYLSEQPSKDLIYLFAALLL